MTPQALAGAAAGQSRSAQRREMAVVLGLAALAALAVLGATSQSWLGVTAGRRPPFGPLRAELTGRAEYPALTGLAVVALLAVVLVLVTGGLVRRVLGTLLMAAGAWVAWYAARGIARPGTTRVRELLGDRLAQGSGTFELRPHPQWAVLTLLAAVLLALCGLALLVRGGRWQVGMSARYGAPAAAAESGDPWRRLDRGEDPTAPDR